MKAFSFKCLAFLMLFYANNLLSQSNSDPIFHTVVFDFSESEPALVDQFMNEIYMDCDQYINPELRAIHLDQLHKVSIVKTNGHIDILTNLSTVGVKNKCNQSIGNDYLDFDPSNFNPLKYFFDFNSASDNYIWVDGTQYYIYIQAH